MALIVVLLSTGVFINSISLEYLHKISFDELQNRINAILGRTSVTSTVAERSALRFIKNLTSDRDLRVSETAKSTLAYVLLPPDELGEYNYYHVTFIDLNNSQVAIVIVCVATGEIVKAIML